MAEEHEVIDLTLSDDEDSVSEEEDHEGSASEDGHDGSGDASDSDGGGSDASEEIEIHLNEETRTQLRHAIATVSETRLRGLLNSLLETDQAVEIALTRELITVKRENKRVVPRWAVCVNCDAEYEVNMAQDEDECVFHPGELEVAEDGFADWDEVCHGPMDTPENQKEYPNEFEWTCCDKRGDAKGCVRGMHKPQEVSKKRKRE
ncbi:hypothetical protein NMY22_g13037 [Coprinellus aureogranulatus]|nr:hypothetical protein NMY22_g13037 [Coprinellus aureogranulatus]